jgi:hypothetical protein
MYLFLLNAKHLYAMYSEHKKWSQGGLVSLVILNCFEMNFNLGIIDLELNFNLGLLM